MMEELRNCIILDFGFWIEVQPKIANPNFKID
jgi:hypothetical protein